MEKEIKIIQISACVAPEYPAEVFGLGEDNKVYYWDERKSKWVLNIANSYK